MEFLDNVYDFIVLIIIFKMIYNIADFHISELKYPFSKLSMIIIIVIIIIIVVTPYWSIKGLGEQSAGAGSESSRRIAGLTILQAITYFGDISDIFQSVSVSKLVYSYKDSTIIIIIAVVVVLLLLLLLLLSLSTTDVRMCSCSVQHGTWKSPRW